MKKEIFINFDVNKLKWIRKPKDYNIEKEDAEDWVENNKEELNDE